MILNFKLVLVFILIILCIISLKLADTQFYYAILTLIKDLRFFQK